MKLISSAIQNRPRVATAVITLAGLVLVGFAVWCTVLIIEVSTVRDDVSQRVGWLQQLHELQSRASEDSSDAALRSELDALHSEIEAEESSGPPLRELATQRSAPPADQIEALIPAIREETGQLSAALGRHWTSINWLAGIALALAMTTLLLLVYVRYVLLARAQRTVAGLQTYLRDADRLAAVGTLAAGVAHELSNPLTYVATSLELLSDELGDHELANEALRGTHRVMGIVRDLRAIARPTHDDLSPCDAEACLDATLNITRRETRNVAKVVQAYGGIRPVWGSDARLGQLFLNLIINATHAMADGKRKDNELRITTRQSGPLHVEIEIRDTGPGIPPVLQDRVFEPFVTSKPIGKGTGLGLFVCHNIVRSLDGTIDLESSSEGTTVTVRLPAAMERTPEPEPESEVD